MVMQQIANLSSRLGCIGSSPILSAIRKPSLQTAFRFISRIKKITEIKKYHRDEGWQEVRTYLGIV